MFRYTGAAKPKQREVEANGCMKEQLGCPEWHEMSPGYAKKSTGDLFPVSMLTCIYVRYSACKAKPREHSLKVKLGQA